ncbi:MAG TPA: LuxR C-terminal-related transcriptional regulator [Kofleriaceae bacterium]|nr:LuxR C-terminal-related transcriptional regulator [Kofleriaceae bacterium]
MHSLANKLHALSSLYDAARRMRPVDFAMHAFQWLLGHIGFDRGIIATSRRSDPTWLDAHFWGIADPRALMESYTRVRHLDVLSQHMLERALRAHRIDIDDPEISGPRFTPLREHFRKFGGIHVLGIAVPIGEGAVSSVFMLARGKDDAHFTAEELELFEVVTPHFAQAAAVNRLCWLPFDNDPSNADTIPVALIGPDGRFMQMTPAFAQLFWPAAPPDSAYLPESIFAELRESRVPLLPSNKHSLYGQTDNSGNWLLRIRSRGPLDWLTPHERQVAWLFARGVSYEEIAQDPTLLDPAFVRKYLRQIYERLRISNRHELAVLFARR